VLTNHGVVSPALIIDDKIGGDGSKSSVVRLVFHLTDLIRRKYPSFNMQFLPTYLLGQEIQLQHIEIWIPYNIPLPGPANVFAR